MTKKYHILCLLMCLSWFDIQAGNYVIINQVMYDTPENEVISRPPYCNGEFVELYNGGTSDVSLAGWSLHGGGTTEIITFADTVSIPSGHYLIVAFRHAQSTRFTIPDYYNLPQDTALSVQVVYQRKIILSNSGETLTLFNANSDIVDQITYEGGNSILSGNATNPDTIPGSQCLSLHRTWAEFDPQGHAINGTAQWVTDTVTFSTNMLSQSWFYENHITGNHNLPLTSNYIVTVTPLDATTRVTTDLGYISTSSGIRTNTVVNYFDGFGRPEQTVAIGATSDGEDLATLTQYAGTKRATKQWLPVPVQTDGQPLDEASLTSQTTGYYDDSRPFTETLYEASALNRVTGQKRAGQTYQSHPSTYTYGINVGGDNVHRFHVTSDGDLQCMSQDYNDYSLYKNTTADEDGVSVTTFTDKLGRKILERRSTSDTYFVYDTKGQLRYVLPSIADNRIYNKTLSLNDTILRRAAFCYQYDGRGNMIYKRLPGCEPQLMVYDVTDRLVLSQDGNQRQDDLWTVYAYDSIGRNLYSAELPLTQTHQHWLTYFEDKWQVERYYTNTPQKKLGDTGYASSLLGNTNIRPLIVNYYDDYEYLKKLSTTDRNAIKYRNRTGYGFNYGNATGLLTGTRVYNLSDGNFTATTYYYDYKGRVIQSHATRNAGGYEHEYIKYNFDGTVAQQLTEQGTDDDLTTEHYAYTYDHAGRLLTTSYRLNDEPELVLSDNSYDELGRLVQNLRHNSSDTLAYWFDMRGTLQHFKSEPYEELLMYEFNYLFNNNITPRYNGNISAIVLSFDTLQYFAFDYDAQNRLTESKELIYSVPFSSESYTYDARGNIRRLQRRSLLLRLDDLVFNYDVESNQVTGIKDYKEDLDLYFIKEYHDRNNSDSICDMAYDANGNLIIDRDRRIKRIAYNYLNLPDSIYFNNGNLIVNHYDASGKKYKSIYYTVLATILTPYDTISKYNFTNDSIDYYVTEYAGNIENYYTREDTVRRVFNTEGYCQRSLSHDSIFEPTDDGYHYYYRNYLGSICAVWNATKDTIVQRIAYHPSGLPMFSNEGAIPQNRKYNGKEFVEAYGLEIYDYGFRGYYPAIGRFTSIDPIAELSPWQSTYSYANNNSIRYTDFMGLSVLDDNKREWIAINKQGNVVDYDLSSSDHHVYMVDEMWDGEYESLQRYPIIGWEIPGWTEYTKGQPCYYLASTAYSNYYNGQYWITGGTALCYGLTTVNHSIDDTINALLHYIIGFGTPIALGDDYTRWCLLMNETFKKYRMKIINGELESEGHFSIDMTKQIFHIGNTRIYYYSNQTYSVFSIGLDGFWDAFFPFEKSEKRPWGIEPDNEGWKLEFGIPYNYIPTAVMLPNNKY